MRTKRVLRYYCDHCGRGKQSKRCMVDHESRCILNRCRTCRTCREYNLDPQPLEALLENWLEGSIGIKELVSEADGCPDCVLAVLKIGKLTGDEEAQWDAWDYAAAKQTLFDRFKANDQRDIEAILEMF